jgi:RNA polymerase sigma-70 factor (ECF subfamily)
MPGASFEVTDDQLMESVSAGSVAAFTELYDRYCDRAYRLALSVGRDTDRAEDAVQEGFLSLWKSAASYRQQEGTVAAWLLTVVRHRAIDLARCSARYDAHRAREDKLDSRIAADDVYETIIKRDDAYRLRVSLASLPDAQHEVIALAFYGQLSHTEIAAHLGLPAGTIKGRMRLGLQKLRADITHAAA